MNKPLTDREVRERVLAGLRAMTADDWKRMVDYRPEGVPEWTITGPAAVEPVGLPEAEDEGRGPSLAEPVVGPPALAVGA